MTSDTPAHTPAQPLAQTTGRFIPVRIGTFRPSQPVDFDIYIQIGERKLHYLRKNDSFDGDRIARLQQKGVKKMFIPGDAEPDYLRYLDRALDSLKDSGTTLESRASLAQASLHNAAESAAHALETQAGFQQT